jgi:hypothetical protein
MIRLSRLLVCGALMLRPLLAAEPESDSVVDKPPALESAAVDLDGSNYVERARAVLAYCATTKPKDSLNPKDAMSSYVARLLTGQETDYARTQFNAAAVATYTAAKASLEKDPNHTHSLDPFFKHALVHAWLLTHEKANLLPETERSIRNFVQLYRHKEWKGYGALNYRLMNDGAGFLAAEQWPDLVDADGLSSEQIKAATKQRLLGYCDDIVHHNYHEYGSPTYGGVDFSAMKMIADFARDPEIKQHATLTLDWMLLNVACAWNQGYHVTPAGRAKYWGSSITSPDEMDSAAAIGWLYFGGLRPVNARGLNHVLTSWFASPLTYRSPSIFADIAADRTQPLLHRASFVAGGNDIRLSVYHTPTYSLASEWEFLSGPTHAHYKESRRQMLKWISPKSGSTFCPLQENARRPYALKENVANAFGYGENPFSQSLQHAGTLIGLIAVPDAYPYWKLYAPFNQSGSIVKRIEKDGWVFCHGGSMLFAFHPLQPYTWGKPQQGFDVLWSDARKNGWVLETSALTPFRGGGVETELARFADAVLKQTKIEVTQMETATPRLVYTALDGHVLTLSYRPHGQPYTNQQQIDGQVVDYRAFPLLDNPWVRQEVNGDTLTVQHGKAQRVYDFKNWQVTETSRP